ncbi:MAG TPA: endonuclease/exonuclease/phosphatase family protein [bacterium]|nr:endonuclease/exonuclease/phosphatase family protein [bacterium]
MSLRTMSRKKVSAIFVLIFVFVIFTSLDPPMAEAYVRFEEPHYLTFDELKSLSENPEPKGNLKAKLDKFWVTPIISNEAYYEGARPAKLNHPFLGQILRVASWNIEKSFNIDEAIQLLTSPEAYKKMIDPEKATPGSETHQHMVRQRNRLAQADVLILQEMEIGIKRSGYRNAAGDLAKALNMNYAYGTQYLEVDPVILGLEQLEFEDDDKAVEKEARDFFTVDPAKYKGVFGSAVLSRYPIKYVEVKPLITKPYDWYYGEQTKIGATEKMRRMGTKTLFKNAIQRELKVGNRNYFRVDLEVPELPGKTLTIINIHLEIKCQPVGRQAQMNEILSYIYEIKNPVIVMGDFNMAPTDISPTTAGRIIKRTASNPTTWFSVAVNVLSPHALIINTSRLLSNITKNFNDPTAKNVPVVAPNPVKPFFNMMKDYRFADGGAFDFRGDPERSVGEKSKVLANANQRGTKGFVTSFRVLRPIGIVGKYRLDWVFVKSYLKHPESGPYKFAPHFGETLEDMNYELTLPVSDHAPNVIDLPFQEPKVIHPE